MKSIRTVVLLGCAGGALACKCDVPVVSSSDCWTHASYDATSLVCESSADTEPNDSLPTANSEGTIECTSRELTGTLGRNGRLFFREHYDWPVIERKYLDMLDRLSRERSSSTIEPLPGWFERRHENLPPGKEVLAGLPTTTSAPATGRTPASVRDPGRRRA